MITSSPYGSHAADISTIFIIGLPDDFKERELQNLFLFAAGYECAVLKATTIQGTICCCGCGGRNAPANLLTQDQKENLIATNSSSGPDRKQLIGFVKFATHEDALYARDLLNGRILDQMRGLVLKAEIAKKNLYIPGFGSAGCAAGNGTGTSSTTATPSTPSTNTTTTTTTNTASTITNALRNMQLISAGSFADMEPADMVQALDTDTGAPCWPAAPLSTARVTRTMSISIPGQSQPAVITDPSLAPAPARASPELISPIPIAPAGLFQRLASGTPTGSAPCTTPAPAPASGTSPGTALSDLQRKLISSATLGSMAAVVGENFPCNTLYVGNLPQTASEEELRGLFRTCYGYRRMSFRPKQGGPMCFVEFEDIACATVAMETLYGTMLSCSVPAKGGIRLSYSKNPLGLRVNSPLPPVLPAPAPAPAPALVVAPQLHHFLENVELVEHRAAISAIFRHYYHKNPRPASTTDQPCYAAPPDPAIYAGASKSF